MKIQLKKLIIGQIQIFKKIINGTIMLKENCKAKVKKTHIEKLKKWNYDKVKGRLFHSSGGFFR